ncbi:HAD family hydrolase [Petropleomorpha daqingensis]|uniref:Phosphatidylglycerophosphatase C n=1 Tax=Petropleomorpha daqingensis TaxID=2026353 RepID=A0A853CJ62_9ACTN|nr:phosphatidylglycerophosphatase C [Petropleomorpha daqingensis]
MRGGVVVFDLDKVLLGGDATTLFLHGRLRRSPARLVPLLLAAPLLVPGSAVPQLRPLAARAMTRLAVGRDDDDVAAVAEAYEEALTRKPEAAVGDAIACVQEHRAAGDVVVVATGCEEVLARGYLRAIGLGDLDVVGSNGSLPPRRAIGGAKVEMLTERGYPPPWRAVYSDSVSDLPLFAGTPRPVLVNAGEDDARRVGRVLGRRPEVVTWR